MLLKSMFTALLHLLWRLLHHRTINIVPYTSKQHAQRAADERRERLREHLAEFSGPSVPVEFIELPPGLPEARLFSSEGNEATAFWRASRLHLQLNRDRHLLIERVIDTLVYLYRAGLLAQQEFPSRISLERIPRWHRRGKYPWRAVIATDHTWVLQKWLSEEEVREWLGIGVDCVPAVEIKLPEKPSPPESAPQVAMSAQGRCREGTDGLEGVVGGVIEGGGMMPLGLTCWHVVSSSCPSVFWPSTPRPTHEFTQESPDAVFIRQSDCFPEWTQSRRAVTVAALDALSDYADKGTKLVKAPNHDGVRGIVKYAEVNGFRLGSHFYRGPHICIKPYLFKRFGLTWPRSRQFSQAGDSGSWIINPETGAWIGMVVGGDSTTAAIASHYLIDAFRRAHRQFANLTFQALED